MTPARRHDIDTLRVVLFGSLILYHVSMLYVADWPWHVKSSYQSEWLQIPMLLINRWRMALLFLISGLALNVLQRDRAGWSLIGNRSRRILVPLIFGMLVIVPIQPYCQGIMNHHVEGGFGDFLLRYYRFQPWPKDSFDGWQFGVTWNHLWYLAYVWTYSVVVIALRPLLESRPGRALRRAVTGLRGGWLLLLPALPKAIALMTLGDAFPPANTLVDDWYQHALFFSYFLFGWWVATDAAFWAALKSMRRRTLGLAVFVWIAYMICIRGLLPDDAEGWTLAAVRLISGLNTWLWIATVLGWSAALLDRPWRWLPYATEAVLPWYVLHQSLIVAVAFVLIPLRLGGVVEPLIVVLTTIAGCGLLHEFVIRRSGLLRALFGMKPRQAATFDRAASSAEVSAEVSA
jgi:hypothetical protein